MTAADDRTTADAAGEPGRDLIAPPGRAPSTELERQASAQVPALDEWISAGLASPATVRSDEPIGEDALGRAASAEMFASILTSRTLTPPIALGIFGEWGSGKTFLIDLIRQCCAAQPPEQGVPTAHITFNAWHTRNGALLPELLAAIFGGLRLPDEDEEDRDQRVAAVLPEIDVLGKPRRDAEALVAKLEDQADEHRQALWALRSEIDVLEAKAAAATSMTIGDVADDYPFQRERDRLEVITASSRSTSTSEDLVPEFEALVERLRDAPVPGSSAEAIEAIGDADQRHMGNIRAFVHIASPLSATRRAIHWILIGAGPFAGVLALLALFLASQPTEVATADRAELWYLVSAFVLCLVLFVLGWAMRERLLRRTRRWADTCERDLARLNRQLAAQRQASERSVESNNARVERAQARADATATDLREARRAVQSAAGVDALTRYLETRLEASTFERQLSLGRMLRRDLDELAHALREPPTKSVRPIERIVLLIDDLDRCPPERVVEVIEASRGLLGTDLFVIVLAIDPEWLLRSLERVYPGMLGYEVGDQEGAKRFLEKVFQLVWTIQPLDGPASAAYMQWMVGPPLLDEDATVLASFVHGSPRKIKRFVNSLAVLAIAAPPGRDMWPGALLLAIAVGARDVAGAIFDHMGRSRTVDLSTLFNTLDTAPGVHGTRGWLELKPGFDLVRTSWGRASEWSTDDLIEWIPSVRSASFL